MGWLDAVNAVLWHDAVLYTLIGVGVLFTVWTGFGQLRALTHGVAVVRGRYDHASDPGAITHFQALSAALSATVGLGNIAGVALAVSIGGPGAVFWMWVTGFIGMALKMTEVTQAMLWRDVRDPANPHGGPMWVVRRGLAEQMPRLAPLGAAIGAIFSVTLLVGTFTGGNMFQAWNVADITRSYFGVPPLLTGVIQMVLVGAVILGGIRRIGAVAGKLVPFMCVLYLAASVYVLAVEAERIPEVVRMIFVHAFLPQEAAGAFLGSAFGWAFLLGMRRALFSNEAGQGSAPIAHAAARTNEPVREGVVAGLEPFIDTLVVCTITAMVILLSGVWNRPPDVPLAAAATPAITAAAAPGSWTLDPVVLTDAVGRSLDGESVYAVVAADPDEARASDRRRVAGRVVRDEGGFHVEWESLDSVREPRLAEAGVFVDYKGATLTARAFDSVAGGLGLWVVPAVAWLFAISTMISWSYYGEQGAIYLFGMRSVVPYRVIYCGLILLAASPLITTDAELDNLSSFGTGLMLFANIPIMLLLARPAMGAYRRYIRRLDAGEFEPDRVDRPDPGRRP